MFLIEEEFATDYCFVIESPVYLVDGIRCLEIQQYQDGCFVASPSETVSI